MILCLSAFQKISVEVTKGEPPPANKQSEDRDDSSALDSESDPIRTVVRIVHRRTILFDCRLLFAVRWQHDSGKTLFCSQMPGRIQPQLLSTHNLKLGLAHSFTFLPSSGHVVVFGEVTASSTKSLHVYVFTGEALEHKIIKAPCNHICRISQLVLGGIELVAVACEECSDIKLIQLPSAHSDEAEQGTERDSSSWEEEFPQPTARFASPKFSPSNICTGESERLLVFSRRGSHPVVLELDCSSGNVLEFAKPVEVGMKVTRGFCYAFTEKRLAVLSDTNIIRAVSCDTGDTVWEVKGEMDRAECNPTGLAFCDSTKTLYSCDGYNHRVLVLDSTDGKHVQTISLPKDLGQIKELCFCAEDRFVVRHWASGEDRVSFFSKTALRRNHLDT